MGTWTAYAAPYTAPPSRSVSPSSGQGMSQTFSFHTNDLNGYAYVPKEQILIASSVHGDHTCSLLYLRVPNLLYLQSDDGSIWVDSGVLGSSKTLHNSQCDIDLLHSSFTGSGNDMYVNLATSFATAYAGTQLTLIYPWDHAGAHLGWYTEVGSWTVGVAPPADFSVSLSPSSRTVLPGGSVSYTLTVAGTNGFNGTVGFSSSLPPFCFPGYGDNGQGPNSITGSGSTTFTVTAGYGVQPGTSTIAVLGISGGVARTATLIGGLTISNPGQPPTITTTSLSNGTVGSTYSQTLGASGGTPPYSWQLLSGALPSELNLNSSGTISSSGNALTSVSAGTYNFSVLVTDYAQQVATKAFSVTISSTSLTITNNTTLPVANKTAAYSLMFSATGGTGPYTSWALVNGTTLPTGLSLNTGTGGLTGAPTTAGSYAFDVSVADSASHTFTKHFNLAVVVSSQEFIRMGGRVIAVENKP
jgi:hypothetical protein